MNHPFFSRRFSPLELSAARRLIPRATVEVPPEGMGSDRITVLFTLSDGPPPAEITLWLSPKDLLCACPLCGIEGDLPCPHAIAALEILREKAPRDIETPGESSLPPPSSPSRLVRASRRAPPRITALVLAGHREAPLFVALKDNGDLLSPEEFAPLTQQAREGESLPMVTALFAAAFVPFTDQRPGQTLRGFRPRRGETDSLFALLREGLPVLSARTRSPYRVLPPTPPPRLRLTGEWAEDPGAQLRLHATIDSPEGPLSPKIHFFFSFGETAIVCGEGKIRFFLPDPPLSRPAMRLVERALRGDSLAPAEWMPLLDPERQGTDISSLLAFNPPEMAPDYLSGKNAPPVVRIEGLGEGGLSLLPEIRYSKGVSLPLFGPDRHRLGDYLSDSDGTRVRLISRDRERELYFRNVFEKITRLSHSGKKIPVQRTDVASILDRTLPALESAGFTIDRGALFGDEIIGGPVSLTLDLFAGTDEKIRVTARLLTKAGTFPLPGRKKGEEDSPLLPLPHGPSVYLEGPERRQEEEIRQLFALDGNGQAQASRYYVSMLHLLRPDLPFAPSPEMDLSPFSPMPVSGNDFDRLAQVFSASLRPYQKEAVSFLHSLAREKLSGILADEMGLGKTISVLGFLLMQKLTGRFSPEERPPIVALPASLLYNWAHEAQRFCPGILLHLHAGPDRWKRFQALVSPPDLILTTFGTLRNDPQLAQGPPFAALVMDEAHQVKNPDSLTHKALSQIPARLRIAVTGTPVENHLTDLWGLFALLMPGLLGSRSQFERRFLREETSGEERNRRITLLRNLVSPLILRRTKEMVLRDLPPKMEVEIWVDPTEDELLHIHEIKSQARRQIEQMGEVEGAPLRMAYLTLLLRLRQQACHPGLLPPELRGKRGHSSKFILTLDKIAEGVEEGHKILLFSQFTGMLDLFEEALPSRGISTVRLDGSTPISERQKRVALFQSDAPDSPRVFLSSLKAGGVGLTLTKADYVFHYDPWWNPQVEAQASDRSHRIGQTRSVFIYRFLVRGTVEERVQDLKKVKRDIFSRLLGGEESLAEGGDALSLEEMRALIDFGQ
uniref:Putative helicase, Snf2 family n=1 Tax=Leptospirillum ferrodiazotrophum TaxID=412449 RepID=C6I0R6_9BACT|nr:MAG: putative helicase, Snf2 family [Leptospirillum ferrodiazotrophum]